jgi:hypothetical protein
MMILQRLEPERNRICPEQNPTSHTDDTEGEWLHCGGPGCLRIDPESWFANAARASIASAANRNVRQMFDRHRSRSDVFAIPLIRSGDDGTRTHDPLLANTPDPDSGEQ